MSQFKLGSSAGNLTINYYRIAMGKETIFQKEKKALPIISWPLKLYVKFDEFKIDNEIFRLHYKGKRN